MADPFLAEIAVERGQRGGFAATRRFPYPAHIGYMRVDEVAKGLKAGDGRLVRCHTLIHPDSRLADPVICVVANESLACLVSLSSDLNPVGEGGKLGDGSHFRVHRLCKESS
ncbi:MAG: hypothetical protein AAF636_23185 [Pseudomonadota bacterium]